MDYLFGLILIERLEDEPVVPGDDHDDVTGYKFEQLSFFRIGNAEFTAPVKADAVRYASVSHIAMLRLNLAKIVDTDGLNLGGPDQGAPQETMTYRAVRQHFAGHSKGGAPEGSSGASTTWRVLCGSSLMDCLPERG